MEKVKLPKEVCTVLDRYPHGIDDFMVDIIMDSLDFDSEVECEAMNAFVNSDDMIYKLADAFRYGWEPLPEKKYYLYLPKTKR